MDGWMVKVQRHFKHASSGYIMPEGVLTLLVSKDLLRKRNLFIACW